MAIKNCIKRLKRSQRDSKPSYSGQQVEQLAAKFLIRHQLKVLDFNYRCRRGEIDLIMQECDIIVFVEVRYRRSDAYGSPVETVDHRKQKKLLMTAEFFLQNKRQYQYSACRFDVIGAHIDNDSGKLHFNWIKNAFSY